MSEKKFLFNFLKFNIFIFIIPKQELAKAATNYLSDNDVSINEASQQSFYAEIPQGYFLPYQKYITTSNHKYIVSQPENQILTSVSSTEKKLLFPESLDTSKFVASQMSKPVKGKEVSYPYLYTLSKAIPTTAATFTPTPAGENNGFNTDVPKKYHYGYRISNPDTGTEFGHSEVHDGLSAKGYYHVLLPDGRLQNVKYWAGPSGYYATVTYETHH